MDRSDGKKTDDDRVKWKGSLRGWGSNAQMKTFTFQVKYHFFGSPKKKMKDAEKI